MGWKDLVPFAGEMTTRHKIRKLENEAGSLPIMFGVFVTKIFESLVAGKMSLALNFAGAALLVAAAYIYGREVREAVEEKAEHGEPRQRDRAEHIFDTLSDRTCHHLRDHHLLCDGSSVRTFQR